MARQYIEFNPSTLSVGETTTAEIQASNGSGTAYQWFFRIEMTLNSQAARTSNVTIKVALRNASNGTYWSGVPLAGVGGIRLFNGSTLLHDGGQAIYTNYNGTYSYTGSTSYRYELHNAKICEWTGDIPRTSDNTFALKFEYYINTGYTSTSYGPNPFNKTFNGVTFPKGFASNSYIKINGTWKQGISWGKSNTWKQGIAKPKINGQWK